MSPPTKAPPDAELEQKSAADAAPTGGEHTNGSKPSIAGPQAAVIRGQQTAGNRAIAQALGAPRGVQRAPNDEDPRTSGMAHGPTLDASGGVAVAPTMLDPRRSGMAHGPTLDASGGVGTAPTSPGPGGAAPVGGGAGGAQPVGQSTAAGSASLGDFDAQADRPRRPAGKHPEHIKPPVAVSQSEAEDAYRRDPRLVHRSTNESIHGQHWHIDPRAGGGPPPVYRSGKTYIVHPDVQSPSLPPPRAPVEADEEMESRNIREMSAHLDRSLAAKRGPTPQVAPPQTAPPVATGEPRTGHTTEPFKPIPFERQPWAPPGPSSIPGGLRPPQLPGGGAPGAPPPSGGPVAPVGPGTLPGTGIEPKSPAPSGPGTLPGTGIEPKSPAPGAGPTPGVADVRAQRVAEGMADMEARTARRVERANVQPIHDPDEAARIFLDRGSGARGNVAVGRRDMFLNRWRDVQPQRQAPVAGWINSDGTVVIDRSNPLVKDAVERLARSRGAPGSTPPSPAGPGGSAPAPTGGPAPTAPTGATGAPTTAPAPTAPDPTKAAQTISPTGYVPQERKPAKWDVKGGEVSRETAQEEKRVTDTGTDTRTTSSKKSFGLAKGAGQEWKQRDESQTGGALTAKEKSTRVNASLAGLALNRGSATETGTTPDGPKTRTERNVGATLGPEGAGGTASTAITSQTGVKAEAKGDVKIGPDGIELTGTGTITTPKGFTGHLSVSGKSSAVAKDPVPLPNGKFAVDFVMTDQNGVELGGGWSKPGGGMSVGVEVGSSTSTSNSQRRVFDTKAEAVMFQLTAAMQMSADSRSFEKSTGANDVLAMQEGEVRGTSKTETDTLGGSAGMSVVSVGVTSTDSTTTGLKIEKMAGNKVRVTPSIAEQEALNASISVAGKFGNTKGESTTKSFSVTYEFDLGTDGGKLAYENYKKNRLPPPMPPHAKWIDTTTGRAFEDHDVYKFAHIGEIGWGSHATQQTVEDESGTHTTAVGGQSEKVQLNAIRKLTFDKNRHAEANIVGRMTNGQITQLAGQLTVGGEDGSFNRDQFKKIFSDKGAPAGAEVKSSGEWTLSAEIDKKMFEQLEHDNDKMKQAKTREERLKIYSEMAREGGAQMLGRQVRQGGQKLAWNLELKGDPNFPGAAGRAVLNQQRAKLQAQLKERPDNAGAVAAEAKDTIAALSKRLKDVGDKKKYTDLPDELRQVQVDLINTHIAEFKSVRSQALSVQMRGGRREDLTDVLLRAANEHGYADIDMKDRAWRKAQDLVTIHETELHTLEAEVVGTRRVVMKMFGWTGDVRWGKGIHKQVFESQNAKAKEKLATFKSMAPQLTEAVGKMRLQKERWSAEPDPKERENLLREYDAYLIAAIQIMDVQLTALREAAKEAYIIAPDAAVRGAAALKVIETVGADKTARANAVGGMDIDGSPIE